MSFNVDTEITDTIVARFRHDDGSAYTRTQSALTLTVDARAEYPRGHQKVIRGLTIEQLRDLADVCAWAIAAYEDRG